MFEQEATDYLTPEIVKTVYLTHPVETRNFKLDIIEAAEDIVLEMDLIGMLSEERKEQHPYLEQQIVDSCN